MARALPALVAMVLGCSSSASSPAGDTGAGADPGADPGPADAAPELPPYVEPAARVLFDLESSPVETPFPYDRYAGPDGHLRLDEDRFSSAMLPMVYTEKGYRDAFAGARRFATYGPVAFLASVAVDPASLPANGEASLAEDASIRLHRVGADGKPGDRVAFRSLTHDYEDGPHLVSLYPMRALETDTRHFVAITDRLRAADGTPLGMSAGFARLMGRAAVDPGSPAAAAYVAERARISPLVEALPEPGRVIAAVDFTTGSVLAETDRVFEPLRKGAKQATIPYDLDLDDDGRPDAVAGAGFDDCKDASGATAYGIEGAFRPLTYTAPNPDRHFHATADGFEVFPSPTVSFWLMVPAGAGPFPVVVLGHGIGASHSQHCRLAREMAAAGLATLRFDWPRHGPRGTGSMDFLTIPDPLGVLANFRQAAVDLGSAVLAIEAMAAGLDAAPLGAPDGKPDLDGGRIGYVGHSLGGIIGMLYLPFSDRVKVAVINEASVGLFHLVDVYLFKMINIFGPMGYVHAAPHLLWGGDGASFARHVIEEPFPWSGGGRNVLAQELIGDQTIPNVATEALARLVGLPMVEPVAVPVDGVQVVAAAGVTSALVQWSHPEANHAHFTGDGPLTKPMHDQAIEYLRSGLYEGKPRIVH
ncbi:MAG: hypothetical protein FJ087_12915 [Deltaproteobacteria bacterium]|nr:hypothetical protein [Deltaproteobacteria bacterium]